MLALFSSLFLSHIKLYQTKAITKRKDIKRQSEQPHESVSTTRQVKATTVTANRQTARLPKAKQNKETHTHTHTHRVQKPTTQQTSKLPSDRVSSVLFFTYCRCFPRLRNPPFWVRCFVVEGSFLSSWFNCYRAPSATQAVLRPFFFLNDAPQSFILVVDFVSIRRTLFFCFSTHSSLVIYDFAFFWNKFLIFLFIPF